MGDYPSDAQKQVEESVEVLVFNCGCRLVLQDGQKGVCSHGTKVTAKLVKNYRNSGLTLWEYSY